ncbi:hypothetical protein ES703_62791 [subsurface metagenome]
MAPRIVIAVILVFGNDGPAGRTGIKPARVLVFPIVQQISQKSISIFTARLISISKHAKRWMIAIGLQDTVAFGINKFIDGFTIAHCRPCGTFDLKGKSHPVGGLERRLGWAPGMETHVIQSVCLGSP